MPGRYNKNLGRLRNAMTYTGILVVVVLARPSPWSLLLGLIPLALGESVRLWAAGHLFKTQQLILSGPYRYTRNPLYLGRLLILTGLCVMVRLPYGGSWFALALGWVVFFGYYLPRKERVEPERLRRIHGAPYEEYFRSVPPLFPTFRPYPGGSKSPWRWERMLRNREHWMVFGLLLVTAILLWRAG